METNSNEKIYAFDSLYTTNHIQMLKILLPCFNPPLQKNLALFIKFLELRYTISFLHAHPYAIKGCGFDKSPVDWHFLKDDLLPFLTPQEAEQLKHLQKSIDMMKQFSSIQKNMEALKEILPEGMDFESMFRSMAGGASDKTSDSKSTESKSDTEREGPSPSQAGNILKAMMGQSAGSSEDMLKNMMSSSQIDLFNKFNERFQNIS